MRIVRYLAIGVLVAALAFAGFTWQALRGSLPQLDGEIAELELRTPATIERDAAGSPTIRARSRADLAFATGYAHAQDRYFQMDLMRRAAAGELAALLGPSLVDSDRRLRIHGFRSVAGEVLRASPADDRALLDAYTRGVNAALEHAGGKPWEYLLLRVEPEPWRTEDSVLVAFSMYLNLNDSNGEEELARGRLKQTLPPALYAFLHPFGTEWDAPVTGGVWRAPPPPGPEVIDLRAGAARVAALSAPRSALPLGERLFVGSNSWAVAGQHADAGAALLANDMHLGLRLPHVWYRARLVVDGADEEQRDLAGVTLPGLPMLIAGSNGQVAWGFTNSYGDWTDLVIVEPDPADPARYRTAGGAEAFGREREQIEVRGEPPVALEFRTTRWGPVVQEDEAGRAYALAWTAHHARATNLRMLDLERAASIEEALTAANGAGAPVQNILVADRSGRIGWSVMGQAPVRANYDSTTPSSWSAENTGWIGWRAPQEYPRILDPASGRLWTANTRTIEAEAWLAFLGDGGFDLGARAAQIRDGLLALERATPADMLAIQLDDRALFLTRWRDLFLDLLDERALAERADRAEARRLIDNWSGRAAPEDVGYRIVRAARLRVRTDVFESLTALARERYPDTTFTPSAQFEGALWRLATERPEHLLDPRHDGWTEALLSSFDAALNDLKQECGELETCTWGRENTLAMRHPLSPALPWLRRWIDMPAVPMAGDSAMPRVQGANFGASERLVVSPGREAEGLLQLPGGPVDHPLSPFYGAGHDEWVRGEPTPLLPGDTLHTLRLIPRAEAAIGEDRS